MVHDCKPRKPLRASRAKFCNTEKMLGLKGPQYRRDIITSANQVKRLAKMFVVFIGILCGLSFISIVVSLK